MNYSNNPALISTETKSENDGADIPTKINYAQTELDNVKKLIKKWQDAFESGLSIDEFRDRVKELSEKRLYLETQISAYQQQLQQVKVATDSSLVLAAILKDFPVIWQNADFEERQKILTKIVKKVTLFANGNINLEFM